MKTIEFQDSTQSVGTNLKNNSSIAVRACEKCSKFSKKEPTTRRTIQNNRFFVLNRVGPYNDRKTVIYRIYEHYFGFYFPSAVGATHHGSRSLCEN